VPIVIIFLHGVLRQDRIDTARNTQPSGQTRHPQQDEIGISSLVLPANLREYFVSRNEFHVASVDLGNPSLDFLGPQTVNLGMSGQVETGEEFLDQTHPRIRWQRKRLVKYLFGNDSHIPPPLADIEPQKATGCKSLSPNVCDEGLATDGEAAC
jgi:hypothetical protein